MHIEFDSLRVVLRATGKRVLAGVTGQLRPAKLTAIMGPSGAGKTTLLNTLAGKMGNGKVTGRVRINGRPDRLERYRNISGFVPQACHLHNAACYNADDIVHASLTVEENLLFSARYRLPATTSHAEHLLSVLLLSGVRHELVGDTEVRGISGGQRKGVNIGIELVTDPALLFLDEPTSGLDSTSSKLVVATLQQVSRMGVTVAAVVHQPSYEIFAMFDDLLLLCEGGRTAFYGGVTSVQGYFEGLGYSVPVHANPADIFMDIVAGLAARSKQPSMGSAHVQGTMSPSRAIFAQHAAEVWSTFSALLA
ncbi:P-loop containing nucleoside triphosphate hydrolase protein [Coccomyxa subellipsoidea C-169]|uniref:P-loop containing nucleoside triphosphate hydrolase protein n=1 Tax=Coccomyxa subellipsoidea (strain C-169) TaxID=574566 RepID=I0Z566_COCSC|nr:P-loop containing nucleoside triphosphate hydrolase protein [Coccomyxa subellipsoidea C-169]EIE25785.1 P-loop containing nucleoside triphosphate hydrolase protein [Coccomyxa subellipsoidea C-169]|eukprot:XP_005650329.1 P-loop containing nucleoside triphosphate hydrolase protein [Coccomyxa subellipsoidea C-169]